jgi:hypothetical protein
VGGKWSRIGAYKSPTSATTKSTSQVKVLKYLPNSIACKQGIPFITKRNKETDVVEDLENANTALWTKPSNKHKSNLQFPFDFLGGLSKIQIGLYAFDLVVESVYKIKDLRKPRSQNQPPQPSPTDP